MNILFPLLLGASIYAPETWFHVIGGNASKEGAVADVAALAEAGVGGIQFFHGGWDVDDPWPGMTNMIPCLSEKWVDLVKTVESECHRRGLAFKMQNCPGWSMSGGPWISHAEAMRKLVCHEKGKMPKFGPDDDYHEIGEVTFPVAEGTMMVLPGPRFYNSAWTYEPDVEFVVFEGDREIMRRKCPTGCWQDRYTMSFDLGGIYDERRLRLEAFSSRPVKLPQPRYEHELKLDHWEPKVGRVLRSFDMVADSATPKWTREKTLVFGHVNAKRVNAPAPKEGRGWECDKLSAHGFESNFRGYLGRLLDAGVKIDGTLVDSWECQDQSWTWKMEEEFQARIGYALRPWLPALFGYIVKNPAATEKFLLDWRNCISRMIEENYYGTIARICRQRGMHSQYETAFGDVVVGDLLRFWKFVDEPMCEFWSPFDNSGGSVTSHDYKPVLPCVSAAHVYGKRRVSAESLTSFKLTFNENFREWKQNIDRHFGRGVNHVVLHTFTHNPVIGGKPPSSSLGNAIGSPFLRLQTWWPYMKDFTAYIERCSRELERGLPVIDILMYLGDQLAHKPDEHELLFNNRYKYDYCNYDVLETRLAVKGGRLVTPEGMGYRVLWIPAGTFLRPETERRLGELEKAGARIVRGGFTPDWESPIAWCGRVPDAWYQRREGGEDIFFIADFAGDSSFSKFVYFKDGKLMRTMEPVTGKAAAPANGSASRRIELRDWSRPLRAWKDLPGSAEAKAFSGTREYVAKVNLGKLAKAGAVTLDLGRVCDWASVFVNGRQVRRLWCAPYACDIADFVKDGENEIRVEVTSTWYNRLVYDASLPEGERQTWTLRGPGKESPLAPSGLIGPVNLMMEAASMSKFDNLDRRALF